MEQLNRTSWDTTPKTSNLVQPCRTPSLELGFTALLAKTRLFSSSLGGSIFRTLRRLRHDLIVIGRRLVGVDIEILVLMGSGDDDVVLWSSGDPLTTGHDIGQDDTSHLPWRFTC